MYTGTLISAGDVAAQVSNYGSAIQLVMSALLVLAALFIFKGAAHWILSMAKSAISFGGR
jgi:hypothetical protein